MPIFSHSDNSSLYPHQSTASGDRDGKHRQSLCSSFSDGEREAETGTSIMPCFFVHQYGAVNHICYILRRDRLHTCILTIQGKRSPASHIAAVSYMFYKM